MSLAKRKDGNFSRQNTEHPAGRGEGSHAPGFGPEAGRGWFDAVVKAVSPYRLQHAPANEEIEFAGDKPALLLAHRVLENLEKRAGLGEAATASVIDECLCEAVNYTLSKELALRLNGLLHPVRPHSFEQLAYMEDLLDRQKSLVFGIGPTGTGKTHLAMLAGIHLLAVNEIKHFVITRPHEVYDGEVVTPEIRSETRCDEQFAVFHDILHDVLGHDEIEMLIDNHRLQILPLGTLRGRTFNNSFILVDEAQSMSVKKMRMAVTRSGENARMVITGDPSQKELKSGEQSGLTHLLDMLKESSIARVHRFTSAQVIHNKSVAEIEALYAREDPAIFA